MEWKGVMPAITTCFDENLQIDHEFTARHVKWLIEKGCTGIVCNGSLGEGATLSFVEKIALWKTCIEAVGEKVRRRRGDVPQRKGDGLARRRNASGTCDGDKHATGSFSAAARN